MAKISNTIKVKKDDGKFEDIQISYIQPNYCTAEGYQTTASGDYSHAEGRETMASGEGSHAEGGGPHYGLTDCFISGAGEYDSYQGYKYTITFDTLDQTTDVDAIDDVFKQSLLGAIITTVEGRVGRVQSLPISGDFFMVGMDRPLGSDVLYYTPGVIYRGGALGLFSHAEGMQTTAFGPASHAEGWTTTASGEYSHAEGGYTSAHGDFSHAEGYETIASGSRSHAEGYKTQASAAYAHAEGNDTTASGEASHAEGGGTQARESYSHAEGAESAAIGIASHAEGYSTTASGIASHTEGLETWAEKRYSHAEGVYTRARGEASHAEGNRTNAYGFGAHAEGDSTNMITGAIIDLDSVDDDAIIDAWNTNKFTLAFGPGSHAEGDDTLALGIYSHAEGGETIASGMRSHAEGQNTIASGDCSHASGRGTAAGADYQFVIGKYNLPWQIKGEDDPYVFMIGNGDYHGTKISRSNAMTVDWNGKGSFASTVGTNGADYAEYFEWEDKNILEEDRIGYLVSLNKNKIQKAQYNDNILGIISGTAGMLGDNYEWEWKNKYLTDNFGRILYEEKEQFIDTPVFDREGNKTIERKSLGIKKVPKLNPEYNPDEEYVSRARRPEWDIVGLMGKLYLRDDGTCVPGEYAKVGTEPGIATYSETETKLYVMERVNDNIIRVFLK